MSVHWAAAASIAASVASTAVVTPLGADPAPAPVTVDATHEAAAAQPERAHARLPRKKIDVRDDDVGGPVPPPLLATLVQLHTDERVMLDRAEPRQERFDALLADRVTGSSHGLDPRLLGLLRTLAARYGGPGSPPRIELVSGYRSPKLNEILRKKGHHVASHSQHSRGHACDFRILPVGATKGIDPRALDKEIRALGWDGGVGIYPTQSDWFVHADVGPNRTWVSN